MIVDKPKALTQRSTNPIVPTSLPKSNPARLERAVIASLFQSPYLHCTSPRVLQSSSAPAQSCAFRRCASATLRSQLVRYRNTASMPATLWRAEDVSACISERNPLIDFRENRGGKHVLQEDLSALAQQSTGPKKRRRERRKIAKEEKRATHSPNATATPVHRPSSFHPAPNAVPILIGIATT